MKKHKLKTWPEYFNEVAEGTKTFELRKDDRPFEVQDTVILKEWDPETHDYTGRWMEFEIIYILKGGQFGLQEGYCIMQLSDMLDGSMV